MKIVFLQVVKAGENLNSLQSAAGFNEEFQSENSNYAGRIVISSLMIGGIFCLELILKKVLF